MNTVNHPQQGHLLFEAAIAMAIVATLSAGLVNLIKPLRALGEQQRAQGLADRVMAATEGFAITRGRLPCPASIDNGQESLDAAGQCVRDHGFVPWHSLSLSPAPSGWHWSVASLRNLGAPFAHTLTQPYGVRRVPLDELSRIVLNPPGNAFPLQNLPAHLPALRVCLQPSPNTSPHNALDGRGFCRFGAHSLSAVVVVSDPASANAGNRAGLFALPRQTSQQTQVRWLSYERLIWLWLQTGVLPGS